MAFINSGVECPNRFISNEDRCFDHNRLKPSPCM